MIETPYLYFEIKEGILYATYKQGLTTTLEVARQMVQSRLEFIEDQSYPMLIRSQGIVSIDKSARDYFSSDKGVEKILAGAFILPSVFNKFLINFYLAITKPKVPNRVFTDEQEALKWLTKYKKN